MPYRREVLEFVLFDRLFRYPCAGDALYNTDAGAGVLLGTWLLRHGVLKASNGRVQLASREQAVEAVDALVATIVGSSSSSNSSARSPTSCSRMSRIDTTPATPPCSSSTKANVRRIVADLRARAAPRPIMAFLGATVVVGRTEREARDLLEEYRRHASVEGALAHAAASLGIDFGRYAMDEPIDDAPTQAIRSNVEAIARALGPGWSKRKLIDRFVLGSRQEPIVGDADQVVDALAAWVAEADVDGFNLSRTVMPECLEDFIELVVPRLQERGIYKREYGEGTYREKLFGSARLQRA